MKMASPPFPSAINTVKILVAFVIMINVFLRFEIYKEKKVILFSVTCEGKKKNVASKSWFLLIRWQAFSFERLTHVKLLARGCSIGFRCLCHTLDSTVDSSLVSAIPLQSQFKIGIVRALTRLEWSLVFRYL